MTQTFKKAPFGGGKPSDEAGSPVSLKRPDAGKALSNLDKAVKQEKTKTVAKKAVSSCGCW